MHSRGLGSPRIRRCRELPCLWRAVAVPILFLLLRWFVGKSSKPRSTLLSFPEGSVIPVGAGPCQGWRFTGFGSMRAALGEGRGSRHSARSVSEDEWS